MALTHHTPRLVLLEDAATVLFCLVDDAYPNLNPEGLGYAAIKRLSDSEVITLALLQQLRGVESERSFLRESERFFCGGRNDEIQADAFSDGMLERYRASVRPA